MKKLAILAAAAMLCAIARPAGATVTWNFIVSSCTFASGGGACDFLDDTSIATMAIDQPTGSGTASWDNSLGTFPPPVITGDPNFDLAFSGTRIAISPPSYELACEFAAPCFYDLTWSETSTGLSLDIVAQNAELGVGLLGRPFGPTGGFFFSILNGAGCAIDGCDVVGSWQSNLVSEPMSVGLLMSGLLGLAVARRFLRSGVSAT